MAFTRLSTKKYLKNVSPAFHDGAASAPIRAWAVLLAAVLCCFVRPAEAASGNAAFTAGTYRITAAGSSASVIISAAGIRNTTATTTTGSIGLELWYLPAPYNGGSLSGFKIAARYLPIAQCTSSVLEPGGSCVGISVQTPIAQPPAGTYYPVLALVEHTAACVNNNGFCVDDVETLTETSTGSATVVVGAVSGGGAAGNGVAIVGTYSYSALPSAGTIQLNVSSIVNSSTRTTGTLRLELWLTSTPYFGGNIIGNRIAAYKITGSSNGQLGPNQFFSNIAVTTPITTLPSAGTYYVSLVVSEFTQSCGSVDGYCIDTYGSFATPYVVGTSTGSNSALLLGTSSYTADLASSFLQLNVSQLWNSSITRTTGSLRLEMWLTSTAYAGGNISGNRIAVYQLVASGNGTLAPNQQLSNLAVSLPMTNLPAPGAYFATLVASEYTQNCGSADGYCIATYLSYASPFVVPTPQAVSTPGSSSGSGGGVMDFPELGVLLSLLASRRLRGRRRLVLQIGQQLRSSTSNSIS